MRGGRNDASALKSLKELLKTPHVDSVEEVLRLTRSLPLQWRRMTVAQVVRRLRSRLDMTQRQLAALSGLAHCQVARIERGQNPRVATLAQLFAGFGCGLVLVPHCALSAEELWRRTTDISDGVIVRRRRRYPR